MAQDEGKITISIQYGDGSGVNNTSRENEKEQKKDNNTLQTYATHIMLDMVKTQSIKAFNSSVAMIGNLTGEYQKQMDIQNSLGILDKLASIGLAGISGFTLSGGNPIGALVGVGVKVVGDVVDWGFNRANYLISVTKQNYEIEMLRTRAGLNGLMDGSRGTEN